MAGKMKWLITVSSGEQFKVSGGNLRAAAVNARAKDTRGRQMRIVGIRRV